MLVKKIVEPSTSPWASHIVMVRKSEGSWRICVNYKRLNDVCVPGAYALLYVISILVIFDIKLAYLKIPPAEESRPFTAITVPNLALLDFKRMCFGLHSSPEPWQRLADKVFKTDQKKLCFYLRSWFDCVYKFFRRTFWGSRESSLMFSKSVFSLNRERCIFCRTKARSGYYINSSGLLVDPKK